MGPIFLQADAIECGNVGDNESPTFLVGKANITLNELNVGYTWILWHMAVVKVASTWKDHDGTSNPKSCSRDRKDKGFSCKYAFHFKLLERKNIRKKLR